MTQSTDLQKGLVRILADGGEAWRVVGAGFLVSSRHILTCAHVVADALGIPEDAPAAPTAPVWLDWPLLADSAPMAAKVDCWYPVREGARLGELEDIAVLELDGERPLPDAAQPVPVVMVEDRAFFDRPVRLCGFPEGMDEGDWISGQLQGPTATGWVQLDPDLGRRGVAPGFSGAAVWDKQENAVVGMIVSTQTRAGTPSAYLIPVASLSKAWPDLGRHSRPPNPYRGLAAFREQDQEFFLGRQADSADLQDKVTHHPLVLLVGTSGGGKSSLVFAGLLPALRREKRWRVVSCRPGYPSKNPFGNLALGLLPLLYADPKQQADQIDRYEADLSSGKTQLHRLLQIVLQSQPAQRLLLVIDQFEELYTQSLPPVSRQRFLDQLLQTVQAQGTPPAVTVLLTLRADFLGQVLDYQPFNKALSQDSYPKKILAPLGLDALRAVIAEPARQLGVELEPGLLERILQDLGPEPGKKLPLLEFALTQLWEQQAQRTLSHQAYEAIGGVDRALARHADAVLQAAKNQQDRIRRIFVQLVQPGAGTEDTRHVATREQVGAENWPLVAELATQRLVLTGRIEPHGPDTVEVVHEALIQHWEPLRQWMETYREFRAWQERLRQALAIWRESSKADDELLRGARLAEAEERLNDHADILSQAEQEYIKASIALREWETATRRRGRRLGIVSLMAFLILASILVGLATLQRREAIEQRDLALARQLAAQAALRLDKTGTGLVQSALLVTESLQRDLTASASVTWTQAMDLLPRHQPIPLPYKGGVLDVAFRPDSQHLVTASMDGTAWEWDATTGRELDRFTYVGSGEPMTFSPDSQRLAIASVDGSVQVWDAASGRELARLIHESKVASLAFSPDGQRLATASGDSARVWDITNGRELVRLTHASSVQRVIFSPDGQRLATTSGDNAARVWDVTNGRELVRLNHESWIQSVAFSPNGQQLATAASGYNTAWIWNVTNGRELAKLTHTDSVQRVVFSPDGQRLATVTGDTAWIWDVTNSRELARLLHEGSVWNVVFSSDGQHLATTSDATARMWDVASGRELARLSHQGPVWNAIFSPDGQRLATISGGTAWVWNIARGRELARLTHEIKVSCIAFSPDNKRLATGSFDMSARLWDAASGRELARLAHANSVTSVTFSPDGQRFATASVDNTARVWDATSGRELVRLTHAGSVESVIFSPDGQRLATASWDNTARLWDATSGRELARLAHAGWVQSVTFSPDGQRLATTGWNDETARVWDAASGQELVRLNHEYSIKSIAFSPDGQRLATASWDNTARLWDAASGRELVRLLHKSGVLSVTFSPDSQRLATASWDNTARLWDAASGRELARLPHQGPVWHVVFSPDGQRLATASDDNMARVWDVASSRELVRLTHEAPVYSVAFSPDGQRLATAGDDNMARVWLWRAEDLIAEACKRLPRNLTRQEWRQYVGEEVPYHATCPNLPVPED